MLILSRLAKYGNENTCRHMHHLLCVLYDVFCCPGDFIPQNLPLFQAPSTEAAMSYCLFLKTGSWYPIVTSLDFVICDTWSITPTVNTSQAGTIPLSSDQTRACLAPLTITKRSYKGLLGPTVTRAEDKGLLGPTINRAEDKGLLGPTVTRAEDKGLLGPTVTRAFARPHC